MFSDAKSGGAAAPNMAKVLKYKLHPDEAFQILSIDKKGLNKKILDDVCLFSALNCIFRFLTCLLFLAVQGII
jgi:hypothetical protein